MSKRKQPVIAICYDFDGTLSPGNMQEHSYFPSLDITPKEFWRQSKKRAKDQEADEILAYMRLMIEKATTDTGVKVTQSSFAEYGSEVSLFDGVKEWFPRINRYGKAEGAKIEHYIISSGIKEMIEGTPIKRYFRKIFASAFMYDQHKVAYWPAQAVNYTTKTQFLFRINKGLLDAWDNSKINAFIEKDRRPVPFTRMIYIGDGSTDIPCMKLVKAQGGYSIAVYQPHSRKKKLSAEKLKNEDRVNFVAPADYKEDSLIDMQVKAVIRQMIAVHDVLKGPVRSKSAESLSVPNEPAINTSINPDTSILPAQKPNDLMTSPGDISTNG